MGNESISQAEIDALIRGELGGAPAVAPAGPSNLLTERVTAFVQGGAASGIALFGEPLGVGSLSTAQTSVILATSNLPGTSLALALTFTDGLTGKAALVLPEALAADMVGRASGGQPPLEWGAEAQGALAEIVSQLLGSGLTRLSGLVGRAVSIAPVSCSALSAGLPLSGEVIEARFGLHLGELHGTAVLLLDREAAGALEGKMAAPAAAVAPAPAVARAPEPVRTPEIEPAPAPAPRGAVPAPESYLAAALASAPAPSYVAPPVAMQRANFPELGGSGMSPQETRNIDLILDVSLQVTVELGRTRKQIREVLALGPGAVIELDKLAGEAIDVLVNGKLIAKGEVVVVDDNFGVRITDIISPAERAASLR